MRRNTVLGLMVLAAAFGLSRAHPAAQAPATSAHALTDAEYATTMKQIGATFKSLQQANEAMNHEEGADEAKKLAASFKLVQAYWEARKITDAVGFAKTAVKASDDTAKASDVMDMDALSSAEKALGATCQGCHTAHRTKQPDGSFKIR